MKRMFLSCCVAFSAHSLAFEENQGLVSLSDTELSDVEGAALLNLSYAAATDAEMKAQNIGFYKLGFDAVVELNANIKHLKLGCGGINGAGACDIDIENLSLSGISDTREGRVASSAQLINPFVQFAIKDPDKAATREVMGYRLSAEKALGLLTAGTENSENPNGINTLSGAIKIKPTSGFARTAARNMTFNDTGMEIKGGIDLIFNTNTPFATKDYNLALQSTIATLNVYGTSLTGNRMTSAKLKGDANIDQLNFGGDIKPTLAGADLGWLLTLKASGNITGLRAALDIDEDLGYIHKLPLNNPFSLLLQKQKIH